MAIIVILLALLGCFFLLRLLYGRFWDKGLSCKLGFREEFAVEGETSALTEVITNRKLLPLPVVEIDFHMDKRLRFSDGQNSSVSDQTYRRDVFALGVRQRITRTLEFDCARRGYFQIREAGITAQDLFLLQKYRTSAPQQTEFYVLPRPVPAGKLDIPFAKVMGAVLSRRKIYDDPFEFAGLREYSRGDPMKYINWKATARAGELLTNLHESTLSQKVTILLDMEGKGVQQADQLNEAAVRLACALSEKLLLAGVELSLYSNGRDALTGCVWKAERVLGAGSLLALKKKFSCLKAENGLPPVCDCLPQVGGLLQVGGLPQAESLSQSGSDGLRQDRETDLLILISRSQRPELPEAFSRLVGQGKGIQLIPFKVQHDELSFFKNVDVIWWEV